MSELRDAPFAFMDLLKATTSNGVTFLISDESVRVKCGACEASFEQSDEGHKSLRAHEFEHGRGTTAHLSELDGLTLRIVTWAATSKIGSSYTHRTPEVWGIDDQHGVAYHLSNSYQGDVVWKWRIRSQPSGVLAALSAGTPSVQD